MLLTVEAQLNKRCVFFQSFAQHPRPSLANPVFCLFLPCSLQFCLPLHCLAVLTTQIQHHQRCVPTKRLLQFASSACFNLGSCVLVALLVFALILCWAVLRVLLTCQPQHTKCCVCLERFAQRVCSFASQCIACLRIVFVALLPSQLFVVPRTTQVQRSQRCVDPQRFAQRLCSFSFNAIVCLLCLSLCSSSPFSWWCCLSSHLSGQVLAVLCLF